MCTRPSAVPVESVRCNRNSGAKILWKYDAPSAGRKADYDRVGSGDQQHSGMVTSDIPYIKEVILEGNKEGEGDYVN
jgi:hypothetical protein